MHGPQHPLARIDQHHAAVAGVELLELVGHRMAHQIGQGPGQLAAGGAAADHQHGLQQLATLGVRGLLGLFERHQHPPADLVGVLDDLHRRRLGPPLLMAEVAAA